MAHRPLGMKVSSAQHLQEERRDDLEGLFWTEDEMGGKSGGKKAYKQV